MATADVMLHADGVSKRFRLGELHDSLRDLFPTLARRALGRGAEGPQRNEFWALKDVSFQVRRGDAFAIIGGNGAGKSTMLKILSGIMRPTTGSIRVTGRLSALIEVSAGFHPDLTGRENIYLNGAILGMSRAEIKQRFDTIVEFSGLERFLDTPVKRYSSGMFARLGFSVAAHVDADVLLVDEVLSVGDYLFQQKCVTRMSEVLRSGTTVVFVSHSLRAVVDLCPSAMLLEHGTVSAIGHTEDVVRRYLEAGHDEDRGRSRPIGITRVEMRGPHGPSLDFESGARVQVVVQLAATVRHDEFSVVIVVRDDTRYNVFDTCTERLGAGPLTLEAGERLSAEFEFDLDLAEGTYHIDAYVHHYVTSRAYDSWERAATFFIGATPRVRGVVNLHPMLREVRVERPADLARL